MTILKSNEIKHFVVHCSESPDGRSDTAEDIHIWHKRRKWAGIGYHAVIERDGVIRNGRPLYWAGSHVFGWNDRTWGVCLIGTSEFTEAQYRSLFALLSSWKLQAPQATVVGHYQLDPKKTCPNFNVSQWFMEVVSKEDIDGCWG